MRDPTQLADDLLARRTTPRPEPARSDGRDGAGRRQGLRVLVLTAPVGSGHLAAAETIEAEIGRLDADATAVIRDVLPHVGRALSWLLRDAYRWQLRRAPWIFGLLYASFRIPLLRAVGRIGLVALGARGLLRLVRSERPDVVVSTYPAATSIVGWLRARGLVRVPLYATVTDLAGLGFWAHPAVELHLVMHEGCVAEVERVAGRGSARVVAPLVAAAFRRPLARAEARRRLGLAREGRLVLISGGGWGVGDLRAAAEQVATLPDTRVLVLAGRNDRLRTALERDFAAEPRVSVIGYSSEMSALLAAADALVHTTGGVTCLEAMTRDCPIVAYGAPPGHARLTAKALARLGLGIHVRSPDDLPGAIERALEPRASALGGLPDAAGLLLTLPARPQAATGSGGRRSARVLVALAATLVLFSTLGLAEGGVRGFESELVYEIARHLPLVDHDRQAPSPAHEAATVSAHSGRPQLSSWA